jgi:hypothetical protein
MTKPKATRYPGKSTRDPGQKTNPDRGKPVMR